MTVLRDQAIRLQWGDEKSFLPLTHSRYRTQTGVVVHLDAPLERVEVALSSAMRAGRQLVKAVVYDGAKIVQVFDEPEPPPPASALDAELETMAMAIVHREETEKPAAGTTVSQPNAGCPMPDFHEADIRASEVLELFLTPTQRADYRSRGAFVCKGADTGRHYLICNREGPALMREQALGMGLTSRSSFRQIFDLDARQPLCIHDWTVPPPEEMLALLLCLTLPRLETKMLRLPEVLVDNEFGIQ